jgi:hypothetical protein
MSMFVCSLAVYLLTHKNTLTNSSVFLLTVMISVHCNVQTTSVIGEGEVVPTHALKETRAE